MNVEDYRSVVRFAREHRSVDPMQLLLHAGQYPEVDVRLVVQQLEGMTMAIGKWPTWAECPEVCYPPRLNREQSSSEATARYKADLTGGDEAADLTGGMGVDCYFMAQRVGRMHYCEMDPMVSQLAAHNFETLGQRNIECHTGDSLVWLQGQQGHVFDTLYIDPARRNGKGQRVAAFEDCTPDLTGNLALLKSHCRRLMVKASPMLDISAALRQTGAAEVHVVAVEGECKELLFIVSGDGHESATEASQIVCVNLRRDGRDVHRFTPAEEQACSARLCGSTGRYLYEPHAALMKGGCYRLLGQWYDLPMIDKHSHLYTSDSLVEGFPGRVFEVLCPTPLNSKSIKKLLPERKAHLISRNYPVGADRLAQQLGLQEGGDRYVIATTVGGKKSGLVCREIKNAK